MKSRAQVVLILAVVGWGSTFIVTKDIVRDCPPLGYLVVRFGLAALVMMLPFVRARSRRRFTTSLILDGAVLGLLNSLGLMLQVLGQVYTTASKSAFITSLNTPLVPLVGLAMYRQRLNVAQLIAVVLATLGLGLLTYPEGGARWNAGDLYTVACAVAYAFTIVQIARRAPHHPAAPLTAVQIAASAATFVVALGLVRLLIALVPPAQLPEFARLEMRALPHSGRIAFDLGYMTLVCTVVTFVLQTWSMARMSAARAAVTFALEPVFATVIAVCVAGAGEWPGTRGAAGACLVLLAVGAAEWPVRRAEGANA